MEHEVREQGKRIMWYQSSHKFKEHGEIYGQRRLKILMTRGVMPLARWFRCFVTRRRVLGESDGSDSWRERCSGSSTELFNTKKHK
jgi:hypothetical protein